MADDIISYPCGGVVARKVAAPIDKLIDIDIKAYKKILRESDTA